MCEICVECAMSRTARRAVLPLDSRLDLRGQTMVIRDSDVANMSGPFVFIKGSSTEHRNVSN